MKEKKKVKRKSETLGFLFQREMNSKGWRSLHQMNERIADHEVAFHHLTILELHGWVLFIHTV